MNHFRQLFLAIFVQFAVLGLGGEISAQSRFDPELKGSDTVVVFVHGILGNADTWGFWPSNQYIDPRNWFSSPIRWNALISGDPSLGMPDTFVFEYDTRRNSVYSISDFGTQLANEMIANRVNEYKNIVFLAHSMGGLVVKNLLTRPSDFALKVQKKTKFVHFYATPSSGASVAGLAQYLADNKHLGQMLPVSEGFNSVDIQNDFLKSLIEDWALVLKEIPTYCAYEKLRSYGVAVVKFESASHGCNRTIQGILASHLQIVKPDSREHPSYTAFRAAFFTEVLTEKEGASNPQDSIADVVAIDTYQYVGSGGDPLETNADEIKDILVQNTTISSSKIFSIRALRNGWDPKVVSALNPKLAFMHFSTFETEKEQCNLDQRFAQGIPPACHRLFLAIRGLINGSQAQIVLYTRTGSACSNAKSFFEGAVAKGLLKAKDMPRLNILGLLVDQRKSQGQKKWFETDASKRAVSFLAETLLFQQGEHLTLWPTDICNLKQN